MSDYGAHTLSIAAPDGWKVVPLKDIVERIIGGGTPSRENPLYWKGDIPWLTVKDMRTHRPVDAIDHINDEAVANSSTNIIPADTVIIATRIGLGKVIRVPFPAAINQDLKAVILKPLVDKSYFEYWMISIASYLESIGSGTTVKGIRLEQLKSLPFPLAPFEQQKRIVAEIEKQFSRLDEAVASLKRVKANLKRYKAAVLKAAVEGCLVITEVELARREGRSYETGEQLLQRILETRRSQWKGKGKYKEPVVPDPTDLVELPKGWVWATVSQFLTEPVVNGLSIKESSSPTEVRALRLSAMSDDGLDYRDHRFLPTRLQDVADIIIRAGDFLVSRGNGSLHLVGRATVAQFPPFDVIFPDTMMRLRLTESINQTSWLIVMWPGIAVRRQIERFVKTTAGIYKISQPELSRIMVPLPPLAEQQRIVAEVDRRLSLLRETEAQVDANLQRAEHLRQSILSRAFAQAPEAYGECHAA